MNEIVLITGASGTLAKVVAKKFEMDGFEVLFYSSNINIVNDKDIFYWDVENKIFDKIPLHKCSHIIHFSGYGIINKWSEKNKKKMYSSRVDAAKLLFDYCKEKKIICLLMNKGLDHISFGIINTFLKIKANMLL